MLVRQHYLQVPVSRIALISSGAGAHFFTLPRARVHARARQFWFWVDVPASAPIRFATALAMGADFVGEASSASARFATLIKARERA